MTTYAFGTAFENYDEDWLISLQVQDPDSDVHYSFSGIVTNVSDTAEGTEALGRLNDALEAAGFTVSFFNQIASSAGRPLVKVP